jgi:hypothetical protein
MKNTFLSILLISLFSLSFNSHKNDELSYFVQFKIFTVNSQSDAMLIDTKMRHKSGVMMSRTDHITSTYYAVLNPGVDYTEAQFIKWFDKLGYTIGCFYKGVFQQNEIIAPHTLKNCNNEK